jgi:hypothetical protein
MPLLDRHVRAFEEQAEVLATMDIGQMWDRMLGEFLGEWERLNRQGLPDAELERELRAFMDGLSDKPTADLARKSSSVAYNQGRSASTLGAAEQGSAQFAVRSEVLDTNTCDECAALDGLVVEIGTPSYYEFLPPAKCLGGDRCRGFYVAVGAM